MCLVIAFLPIKHHDIQSINNLISEIVYLLPELLFGRKLGSKCMDTKMTSKLEVDYV